MEISKVKETDKSVYFIEAITREPVEVTLCLGWINIKQYDRRGGILGHKKLYSNIHLTTEDALTLKECIEKLVSK